MGATKLSKEQLTAVVERIDKIDQARGDSKNMSDIYRAIKLAANVIERVYRAVGIKTSENDVDMTDGTITKAEKKEKSAKKSKEKKSSKKSAKKSKSKPKKSKGKKPTKAKKNTSSDDDTDSVATESSGEPESAEEDN